MSKRRNPSAYASPAGRLRRRVYKRLWPDFAWEHVTDSQMYEIDRFLRDPEFGFHAAEVGTARYMRVRRGLDAAGFGGIKLPHVGWALLQELVGPAIDDVLGKWGDDHGIDRAVSELPGTYRVEADGEG